MSRIGLLSFLLVMSCIGVSWAQDEPGSVTVLGRIGTDGHIVLTGNTDLIGLDFQSTGEYLVPVTDPDPFELLVINTPGHITYGSLSSQVELDGELTLSVRYTPPVGVDLQDDLAGLWGGPGDGNDGSILFVPEPGAVHLTLVAMLAGLVICRPSTSRDQRMRV